MIKTCDTCPANYTSFEIGNVVKCLKYGQQGLLSSAVQICKIDGAKPPLPKTAEENKDLLSFFNSKRHIQQNDFALDLSYNKSESAFVTSTGKKAKFTNWYKGEPNDKNSGYAYVVIWYDGSWFDFDGTYDTAVTICELPCPKGVQNSSLSTSNNTTVSTTTASTTTDDSTLTFTTTVYTTTPVIQSK